MKARVLIIVVGLAVAGWLGFLFITNQSFTQWLLVENGIEYSLVTGGPRFGEDHFAAIKVRDKRGGELIYFRRFLTGLDTSGIPGFKNAKLTDDKKTVAVTFIDNHSEVTRLVPILGFRSDW